MPETAAGEMIIGHLHHDLRSDRLPFAAPLRAPAARAAGGVAGKTGWFFQRLELFRQGRSLFSSEGGRETDVMEQASVVVEAEQKGTDDARTAGITETANHAVDGSNPLDLHHRRPFPRGIGRIATLRDDSVQVAAGFFKPLSCLAKIGRNGLGWRWFRRAPMPAKCSRSPVSPPTSKSGSTGRPCARSASQASRHPTRSFVPPNCSMRRRIRRRCSRTRIAGVAAGRAGDFGIVVGVDRDDQAEELRRNGADVVVSDLAELLGR